MPLRRFASPCRRAVAVLSLVCTAGLPAALMQAQSNAPEAAATAAARAAVRIQRAHHFLAQRATPRSSRAPSSLSPAAALLAARQQSAALPHTANLAAAWQPLGPQSIISATFGNLTGRITALAADPNDATGNTLYVGTTGGGLWRATNAASPRAAVSLLPLTDAQASLSIGAVAVQPQANPMLLAGTGDPNAATDSYYGLGLLRSADGGATWSLLSGSQDGVNGNHSFVGLATAGLAFSTATPSLVVAAFSTAAEGTIVAAANAASVPGLYYSTNSGITWQMATLYDGASIVQTPQPASVGEAGNAATAVVWDALRQQFFAAVRGHGYYSSPDGQTWTRLTAQPGTALTTANCPVGLNGLGSSTCPIFRGALAVQPATGDLYALTVDASGHDQGLWQDLCAASSGSCAAPAPTFAQRLDQGALDVTGTTTILQGTYDLSLAAAPTASGGTLLFAGTVDLYRCALTAGGSSCVMRNTTNALDGCNAPAAVAPAQHALAAVAQSSAAPILYLGNDGGLWRSLDGVAETGSVCAASDASHFDNLNPGFSGSLAELVGLAQHPTDSNTLLVGLGANGSAASSTALSSTAQITAWPQLSAGEGGQPLLDPSTPNNWFLTIGAGVNLAACTLGSHCSAASFAPPATVGAAQVSQDPTLLDAPLLLDPAMTTNVLAGTCRVWRGPAASGTAWSSANALSPPLNTLSLPASTACTSASPLIRSLAAGGPSQASSSAQLSGSAVLYAGLAGALDGGSSLPGHLFVTTTATTAPTWTDAALAPVTNAAAGFNPGGFDVSSLAVDPHDASGATVYAAIMGFGQPHLYRSTDFGAHWTNVSSNLPDAPANAVAIDPNNANTVYVALDTGVYATQTIAACPTSNCWGVLGTGLPGAPVVGLAAAAALPTGDGRLGMLRASTYGRGLWQTPLLNAITLAAPNLTAAPTSLTFAAQQVATVSAAQSVTFTSSGNAPVTISSLLFSGDFTLAPGIIDTCTGQTLAVNSSCTLSIVFAPTTTGTRAGSLTVFANIAGGQVSVSLSGAVTTPATIMLTPLTLPFAATLVNQTTAAQIITVANSGGTTATLQTPQISGDFALAANTCTSTLAAAAACALSITFTPTAAGTRTGTLTLADSVGTQTAQLSGIGLAPATDTLSPNALTFAQQQVGTTSAAQLLTLTNAGDQPLTLIAASIRGDFSVANGCGTSLPAHSTCALSITFAPTATGARSGTLTLTDALRQQTISLTGSGIAGPGVSLTPTALMFSATGVGLSAPAQTLTLTNNGGLPLALSTPTISPGFSIAASNCSSSLAVGAACSLTVVFSPTAAGAASGTLSWVTNATPALAALSLSGTGVDFTLAANGPTSMPVSSGGSVSYPLLLSSLTGLSGAVAFTCAGAPANARCTVAPTAGALGGTQTISVTVQTGVQLVELHSAPLLSPRAPTALLCLLLPALLLCRRRSAPAAITLALLLTLTAATGCAAGRAIPATTVGTGGGTYTTPSGTYNLTLTGSAAGVSHAVGLTLVVQ